MRPSLVTCPGYAGYDGWIYCGTELEVGARGPVPKHCGPCKDAISRRRKDSGVGSPERKSRRRKPLDEERQYQAAVRAVPMPADLMAKGWRGDIPRGPKLRKELTGVRPAKSEEHVGADESTGAPPGLTFDPFWRELRRRGLFAVAEPDPEQKLGRKRAKLYDGHLEEPKAMTSESATKSVSRSPQPWEPISGARYALACGFDENTYYVLANREILIMEEPMTNAELTARIEALEQRLALYLEETAKTAQKIGDRLPDNERVKAAVDAFIQDATRE